MIYNANTPITKKTTAVLPCAQSNTTGTAGRDLWLIVAITNTTNERKEAVLFDASQTFELKEGIQNQDGVLISAQNTSYDALLNDLASGEQYCVDHTQVEVIQGSNLQLDNPWQFFTDLRFSLNTQATNQIDPSIAKDPYQQQANRILVKAPFGITRKVLMKFQMEAQTTMVLRMHLSNAVMNG